MEKPVRIVIPPAFSRPHEQTLTTYLADYRQLNTGSWQRLYEAIDLLAQAQVTAGETSYTFRQIYDSFVDRPFADEYIEKLLALNNVAKNTEALIATYARRIGPTLEQSGLLQRDIPQSWLLLAYCVYWWQSLSRGYAFEVEIMRDLTLSGVEFQMHDLHNRRARYSPADLTVLGLLGDIKTSVYFLQSQPSGQLPNDFYITRLYEKGHERTLVVFQKPFAWEALDGGAAVSGTLENILALLPKPVRLEQSGIILVVAEYQTWKEKVRQKQAE
jgi:hypothetical protein